MEQLKSMKEMLMSQTQGQIANLEKADYHELGAAIDMIKDIAETEYYCSVVKAMEEAEEEKPAERYYYTERYMPIPYQRALSDGMDRGYGRMWYDGNNSQDSGRTAGTHAGSGYMSRYYEDPRDMGGNDHRGYTMPVYDPREGRSPSRRKMYMESKEMHQPKEKQMQELESYMTELSGDIVDMIHGASPEERQMLQKKLSALATKIDQV